jgi:hypothetical protein
MPHIGSPLAVFAVAALANAGCWAEGPVPAPEPRFESYMGMDYNGRSADLSSTLVWGVSGPVTERGFLLKFDGITDMYGETDAPLLSKGFMLTDLKAMSTLMAGYQLNQGLAWVKFYAGAAYISQERIYYYAGSAMQKKDWGAALGAQSYWPLADRFSTSLNLTWLQPDGSTWIYSRALYEFYRTNWGLKLSAGVEANLTLSGEACFREGKSYEEYKEYIRGGGLLNLRYGASEFSLSGGVMQADGENEKYPYVSVGYGRKF